jgi:ATP-dependent helicase/nuclease subunit A
MSARIIPDSVRALQIQASEPTASAFVAANAGAGKTHVLAQRVIRLLLSGVDPAKILCITFTKAAAANMAKRVFDTLSAWIVLDDAELDRTLAEIGARNVDPARRALARRLFASALEAPGGLKVQTIHAFCTRLLQQFPFEANVAARFTVLDERAEMELLNRSTLGVLLDAAATPNSALGRALATAITNAADSTFRDVVAEAIRSRDTVTDWIAHAGDIDRAIIVLSQTLGIAGNDTVAAVEADITDGPILPSREWPATAAILTTGSSNDRKQADRLLLANGKTGTLRLDAYLAVFFAAEGQPRKSLIASALAKQSPDLARRLCEEQTRLAALLDRRRAIVTRDRTASLLVIAQEVIKRYRTEKNRRGLLDYDDLIDKTLAMLSTVNPTWVHYKLDLGIDHVLIDEAQDTSPKQWAIIQRLVAEFTAGAGARSHRRTVFAVGDEKQSIFSFQGAVPREFNEMQRRFAGLFTAAELDWRHIRLQHSFRSGANVLTAVDEVFSDEEIFVSITSDADGIPPHEALPETAPGMVEVWPLMSPEDRREIEGWDAPFDELAETSPQVRLARRIAANVATWITQGTRPGDVLVLVRQRGALFEAIIRALKEKTVPVAGADRLVLTEHVAVVDLMSLADALLLPDDDLALAVVLKSPLIGFDDDTLFKLAWSRSGSVRAALNAQAADDPALAAAAALLDDCAVAARERAPFAFYAWLLGPRRGRAKFLARLGHEATDALDEFLELALDYERRETPSLQGFVAWLRAAEVDIKRDMEMTRDEVRVMTVHGAKGLEAPIVILADTTTRPSGPRHPRLLMIPASGAPDRIVWAGASANDVPVVADARRRALIAAEDEYRRLLYVAMTRAARRLIICGAEGRARPPECCWYNLVFDALHGNPNFVEGPADDGEGSVWRFGAASQEKPPDPRTAPTPTGQPDALPAWLRRTAPMEPRPNPTLSPSAAYEHPPRRHASHPDDTEQHKARARGILVHRLMQSLPDIAPDRRIEAARQYLMRAETDFSATEHEALLEQILNLMADARFASLFTAGSRAEVPIVGRIRQTDGSMVIVSGQIDRLAVTADAVLIADYKTNRPAPRRLEDVPRAYVMQLALYRAVLAMVHPDRIIRAALVWTDVPDLMELSPTMLDTALAASSHREMP